MMGLSLPMSSARETFGGVSRTLTLILWRRSFSFCLGIKSLAHTLNGSLASLPGIDLRQATLSMTLATRCLSSKRALRCRCRHRLQRLAFLPAGATMRAPPIWPLSHFDPVDVVMGMAVKIVKRPLVH